ncbi:MAG: flagellar hook-associated protein FlgK [Janthinobacterium lividum]|uniref:flagellar hook-associated protein FlgK n=1 Tax=Pseudomonas sp. MWU16-30317 TaxID=2878095 RepID=UPI001CF952AD|nr:flagellar hook-associated protein FlgK [Pseudomonas sp. MWU16-30317]
MSLINIGLSSLNANTAALNTISNNIANVDTDGYSRQQTVTTSSALQNIGVGYIGTGTTLSDVRRIYNSFLDTQVQTTTALAADATAYSTQASSTDALLSDDSTGISTTMASFFTQLQAVSTTANDASSRASLLTSAKALTARFNSVASQLAAQNTDVNSQLASTASKVNDLAASIAKLNTQITQANNGGSPNSLLDSRNEAVRQLNELVGAKVIDNNGSYDVYIGNGQTLVSGSTVNTLTTVPSTTDATQMSLQLNYSQYSTDVTSVISGGSIGGLLRYRSDVLTPATNELGRIALTMADTVNSQLAQGVDSYGNFGSALYSDINSDAQVTQRSIGATTNKGSSNFNVSISDTSKLTANDYQVTFTDATHYSVSKLPDGTAMGSYSTADKPEIDGFQLSLNGTSVQAGDTFKITPTRSAATAITTVMTDSKTLAAAGALTVNAGASNSGSGSVTQPALSSVLDDGSSADLQAGIKNSSPVKLVFGATATDGTQSYKVYTAAGTEITSAAGSIVPGQNNALSITIPLLDSSGAAIAGKSYSFAMTVSGTPASNDTYTVSMTAAGSSDNRNAITTLALQTKATIGTADGNGVSLSDANASLVSSVGAKAAQGTSDVTATTAVLTQATTSRDSVSGVNLDEETANLVKYQQYYTASSQIIKAAQTMFDTLINNL